MLAAACNVNKLREIAIRQAGPGNNSLDCAISLGVCLVEGTGEAQVDIVSPFCGDVLGPLAKDRY
jgi:hypothetical protein